MKRNLKPCLYLGRNEKNEKKLMYFENTEILRNNYRQQI